MSSFAKRFKHLREARNWTQDDMADKLGVSRSTIAGYESENKGRIPREENLRKIADIFETSVDFLLGHNKAITSLQVGSGETKVLESGNISLEQAPSIPPEERDFLDWVKNNLEGTFFYDFSKSPEEQKSEMMRGLRLVWEMEKGRKPGQKQGE